MTEEHNKEIWIFLSHSSEDFDKVRLIRNHLEEKSFRPLMFYLKCLESEEEIYDLITREIDVRTRFILCDSENAKNSYWVQREMDYITSREPKRSYQVLDLSKPLETLIKELDTYTNQMNVFISCSRKYSKLYKDVYCRLSKYDLRVLPEFETLNIVGQYYQETIRQGIIHAANNGYFVYLDSEDYHESKYAAAEFKMADELGANVILITLTNEADEKCYNDCSLGKYKHTNIGDIPDDEKADTVVNIILDRILPIGGLKTHADNFLSGRLGVKDEEEAHKLYKHLREQAEKSDNPMALQYIGRCYEYGWGGETIDLRMALNYYNEAIHEPGGPKDEQFLNHVRELNQQLYGMIDDNPQKGADR